MSDEAEDEEWRFELSDLPPLEDEDVEAAGIETDERRVRDASEDGRARDASTAGPDVDGAADSDEDGGNVAGSFGSPTEPEPESPDAENAAFVLLGVVVTIAVFVAPVLGVASPETLGALLVAVTFGVAAVVLGRSFGRRGRE